jgi:hypothetical protein
LLVNAKEISTWIVVVLTLSNQGKVAHGLEQEMGSGSTPGTGVDMG